MREKRFVVGIVELLIDLYMAAIIVRALLSWIPHNPAGGFTIFIARITEPVLAPLRRAIPPIAGRFDVSPLVALVIAQIVKRALGNL